MRTVSVLIYREVGSKYFKLGQKYIDKFDKHTVEITKDVIHEIKDHLVNRTALVYIIPNLEDSKVCNEIKIRGIQSNNLGEKVKKCDFVSTIHQFTRTAYENIHFI